MCKGRGGAGAWVCCGFACPLGVVVVGGRGWARACVCCEFACPLRVVVVGVGWEGGVGPWVRLQGGVMLLLPILVRG